MSATQSGASAMGVFILVMASSSGGVIANESGIIGSSPGRIVGRTYPSVSSQGQTDLRAEFNSLANMWKSETRFMSSPVDKAAHPAYQRIMGMGRTALPWILQELQREPHQWFAALTAIAGENPVPRRERGIIKVMAKRWIEWGINQGLLP